jgi:hypothetical protein
MAKTFKPGEEAPRSGQYEQTGPRGGRTGEERTVFRPRQSPAWVTPWWTPPSIRAAANAARLPRCRHSATGDIHRLLQRFLASDYALSVATLPDCLANPFHRCLARVHRYGNYAI